MENKEIMNDFVEIIRKTVEINRVNVEINLHFVEILFSRRSIKGASSNLLTLYGNAATFYEEWSALRSYLQVLKSSLIFYTALKIKSPDHYPGLF